MSYRHTSIMRKTKNIKRATKEWTLTKILIRLLVYPFCILLFWLSVTIPNQYLISRIFGFIVPIVYFITDIVLILGIGHYIEPFIIKAKKWLGMFKNAPHI